MNAAKPSKKARRSYQKHGLYSLKRAVCGFDMGKLDRRYRVFRVLAEWRSELIRDLAFSSADWLSRTTWSPITRTRES